MGNVIEFGEKGLALSLSEEGSLFSGCRTEERIPDGLTRKESCGWYLDSITRLKDTGIMSFHRAVHTCSLCPTGYIGLSWGVDCEDYGYTVVVFDGNKKIGHLKFGDLKSAEDAYELYRCWMMAMGPRGGGKAKAYQLGKLRGKESFARKAVERLDNIFSELKRGAV